MFLYWTDCKCSVILLCNNWLLKYSVCGLDIPLKLVLFTFANFNNAHDFIIIGHIWETCAFHITSAAVVTNNFKFILQYEYSILLHVCTLISTPMVPNLFACLENFIILIIVNNFTVLIIRVETNCILYHDNTRLTISLALRCKLEGQGCTVP